LIAFTTLVVCAGGGGGSSLEHAAHNKKSAKQIEIAIAEIFMVPSSGIKPDSFT
jgi:uncharacterized protein (UPF0261 family)